DGASVAPPRMRIDYGREPSGLNALQPDLLAAIGFGDFDAAADDPRILPLPLPPLDPAPVFELWRAQGPVQAGRDGQISFASDGRQLFGCLRIEEAAHGDIATAAEHAYRTLLEFNRRNGCNEVLRYWNYLDAITAGEGDDE